MIDAIFQALEKELLGVQKNVLLAPYSNFKIGGPAGYFFNANTKEDVLKAVAVSQQLGIAVFVLGGGTNLIFADEGFLGLVVKIGKLGEVVVEGETISAGAGVGMDEMVTVSIKHSLKGLEWAGGLPGTFGGAIRGNAGAFGGEIKDTVMQVEALAENMQPRIFNNSECGFSYRSSIFKEKNWVILSASVRLQPGNATELQAIADSRVAYRRKNHPLEYPSAGSVFKNVDVKKILPEFLKQFVDKIKQDPFPIVPAAWFIIGAGLTGTQIGQAQISTKHSNYIINLGGAKAQDVLGLIDLVKNKVKERYNIELEVEVQYVAN
ncbi:MAG TPA: UDP-N-acetylmuramate dehydrogenase [Negativicutes bacterium]|nr:UDP-N-acetylmuramate dehydrogenase [Negativicutes bacterium]